jgi:hypothetical protein
MAGKVYPRGRNINVEREQRAGLKVARRSIAPRAQMNETRSNKWTRTELAA